MGHQFLRNFLNVHVRDSTADELLVSFSDHIFRAPPEKWVWSIAYSIFVQVRRNVGALFFSNLMLDVIRRLYSTLRANGLLAKWTLIRQP